MKQKKTCPGGQVLKLWLAAADSLGIKMPVGHSLALERHFVCSRLLIVEPAQQILLHDTNQRATD